MLAAHDGSHPSPLADWLLRLGATLVVCGALLLALAICRSAELCEVTRETLARCAARRAADPVTNTNLQRWSGSMRFEVGLR